MYARLVTLLVGCASAALGISIDGEIRSTQTLSTSSQTIDNALRVVQNLFSTQIVALGPNGQVVFDQTLSLAFTAASVQALLTQATLALNGIGATSIAGPSLTSSQVVFEGSSVATIVTRSREAMYEVASDGQIGGIVTFGPAVVTVGSLACQSFTITDSTPRTAPGGTEFAGVGVPGGCTGGVDVNIGPNGTLINAWFHVVTTNFRDVITTETFRTREVYVLQGQSGATAAIPEPATLGMLLAAGPVFFAWRRRVRQKLGGMRDHE